MTSTLTAWGVNVELHAHEGWPVLVGTHWRCSGCGHRLTVNGVAPIETRKRPWRAPAELLGRAEAKRQHVTLDGDVPHPRSDHVSLTDDRVGVRQGAS